MNEYIATYNSDSRKEDSREELSNPEVLGHVSSTQIGEIGSHSSHEPHQPKDKNIATECRVGEDGADVDSLLWLSILNLLRKSGDSLTALLGFSIASLLAEPNVRFREDEGDDGESDKGDTCGDMRRKTPFSGEQGDEGEHDTSVGPVTEGSQFESLMRRDKLREVSPSDNHGSGDSDSSESAEDVERGDGVEGGGEGERWDSDEHGQDECLLATHLISNVSQNDVSNENSDVLNERRAEVLPSGETVDSKLHGSRGVVAVRLLNMAIGKGSSSQVGAKVRVVVVLKTLAFRDIEAHFASWSVDTRSLGSVVEEDREELLDREEVTHLIRDQNEHIDPPEAGRDDVHLGGGLG